MTNERAIEVIRGNCYLFNPLNLDRTTLVNTALDKAIKALKAEDMLDKIRAEIEALEYLNIEDGSDGYDQYIKQYEVLNIFDKYMTESEDKE